MISGIIAREGIKGFIPYGAGYVVGAGVAAYQAARGVYNLTKKKQTESMAVKGKRRGQIKRVKFIRKTSTAKSRKRISKRTASKRRKGGPRQVPVGFSTGHSGTSSALCIVNLPGKKKVKSLGNWVYRAQYQSFAGDSTGSLATSTDIGVYKSAIVFGLLTKTGLTNGTTYNAGTGAGVVGAQNMNCVRTLFQMNPYQKTTGSVDNAGTSLWANNAIPNNDKLYISQASVLVDLTNFASISSDVQISVFLCKKDVDTDPIDTGTALLSNYNVGTAIVNPYLPENTAQINTGVSDVRKTTLGMPGSRYDEVKDLGKWWKLVCHEQFPMAAGSTKRLDMVLHINKMIDKVVVNASPYKYIKGYSIVCMIRSIGQVVIDDSNEAISGTRYVTYGPPAVGCVATVKYHCSAVKDNVNRLKLDIAQTGISYPTALTNLKSLSNMDTEIGVVVPQ